MKTPDTHPQLLTLGEVRTLLNISRSTVYRRIHDGSIPAVRIGSALRVDRDELHQAVYGEEQR